MGLSVARCGLLYDAVCWCIIRNDMESWGMMCGDWELLVGRNILLEWCLIRWVKWCSFLEGHCNLLKHATVHLQTTQACDGLADPLKVIYQVYFHLQPFNILKPCAGCSVYRPFSVIWISRTAHCRLPSTLISIDLSKNSLACWLWPFVLSRGRPCCNAFSPKFRLDFW
jgi:hypothetical protein